MVFGEASLFTCGIKWNILINLDKIKTVWLKSNCAFKSTCAYLLNVPDSCGEQVCKEIDSLIKKKKSSDLSEIYKIAEILNGKTVERMSVQRKYRSKCKYAPSIA